MSIVVEMLIYYVLHIFILLKKISNIYYIRSGFILNNIYLSRNKTKNEYRQKVNVPVMINTLVRVKYIPSNYNIDR